VDTLSHIAIQSPWWKTADRFAEHDRTFEQLKLIAFERINPPLEAGRTVVVLGPRQVGKTTLVKRLVLDLLKQGAPPRDILYLTLDSFENRRQLRRVLDYFLQLRASAERLYLFLDEITRIRGWADELKVLADTGRLARVCCVLTGSSPRGIAKHIETLPGRGAEGRTLYLRPLEFRRFLLEAIGHAVGSRSAVSEQLDALEAVREAVLGVPGTTPSDPVEEIVARTDELAPFEAELDFLFRQYLAVGGIPASMRDWLTDPNGGYGSVPPRILPETVETFIRVVLGDVSLAGRDESTARQLLRRLLEMGTSRFSYSGLGRDIGISHVTARDYIEVLDGAFLAFVTENLDRARMAGKEQGERKAHFSDPFVRNAVETYLTGASVAEVVERNSQSDASIQVQAESVCVSHLRAALEIPYLRSKETFLWHYRDSSSREIDAVCRTNAGVRGFEVKFGSAPKTRVHSFDWPEQLLVLTRSVPLARQSPRSTVVSLPAFLALLLPSSCCL